MKWRYLVLVVGVLLGVFAEVMPVWAMEPEEVWDGLTIGAVNGGYSEKIDGETVKNNWDFVELVGGEAGVLLDDYAVRYVRSTGTSAEIKLEGMMLGEALLLRYRNSPQKDGDYFYGFDMAMSVGRVELWYSGKVVDSVAWGSMGDDGRYGMDYYPVFEEGRHGWEEILEEVEEVVPQCLDLVFSEIYSYFEEDYAEQFLEIYNPTDEIIELDGCGVRYKKKEYAMSGAIGAMGYLGFRAEGLKLTKNPSTSNYVELLDVTGEVVAVAEWEKGQRKGTSMIYMGVDEYGAEVWVRTYMVTPGAENVWQEYQTCPEGKVINPATGNCIGILEEEGPLPCPEGKVRNPETNRCRSIAEVETVLAPCKEGQYRNPETNRCKSLQTIDNILAPCPEGKYRNPETNRCKSLASLAGATLTPCAEGYERNPETNRCRKIRVNEGADYGVEMMSYEDKSAFLAYGALAAVGICGVVYIVWQFRREIGKPFRLAFDKMKM